MKKVIALMLAVLMLGTVAFAAQKAPTNVPGKTYWISRDDMSVGTMTVNVKNEGGWEGVVSGTAISGYILRSVSSANYSVTNVKFTSGKGLVEKIELNDTENRVDIKMAQDLTNTKAKSFEASFKLKGKAKFTIADSEERDSYYKSQSETNVASNVTTTTGKNAQTTLEKASTVKVTLPDLSFTLRGTVGYGMITVSIGTDNDEDIDGLEIASAYYLDQTKDNGDAKFTMDDVLEANIFKFSKESNIGVGNEKASARIPMAGSFTADAMLTQNYGDALTMEARVYDGDKLYLNVSNSPNKTIVNRLADSDADLDFYFFDTDKAFTTLNSNAQLYFNDADEDCFVYAVNSNGYLVPANGGYSEEDGCWVVKARTLGQYVVSDYELDDTVVVADGADPETANPDTGANDVVGIAAALAAVALVSAAAVSLKK